MPLLRTAALALLLACGAGARADCTRDIAVPVSANGASIVVDDSGIHGIYPDVLRSAGPKAGCRFVLTVVPRARQVAMFEAGSADLLVPATRTPERDRQGVFVPMMGHRSMLISLDRRRPPIVSAKQLLERREIRVAVVRGFDYGAQYRALVAALTRQGRLFEEVDVSAVVRLMHDGAVDMTIMTPTIFAGAANHEPRVSGLLERLRMEPIPELPWGMSGAYISRASLLRQDQDTLRELLERVAKSNAVLEAFQRYHRADVLTESVRPR
ncbi:ABC transporter substrate-binding protein [Rugamonas sp.]|uniref:substrate-binding periplasmic protein n=1 Tax=Rugamonas sp. TaxID=1926287 RepID=UPI0025F71BDF|nr:transporter substrate-binding domain-containing protein [Rugamonas sp.]